MAATLDRLSATRPQGAVRHVRSHEQAIAKYGLRLPS
jgi:hypothetical protein